MNRRDIIYRIEAIAKDEEHEGHYVFTEMYDDVTDETIREKFYNEFGTNPSSIIIVSRERIR